MKKVVCSVIARTEKAYKLDFLSANNVRHRLWVPKALCQPIGDHLLIEDWYLKELEKKNCFKMLKG